MFCFVFEKSIEALEIEEKSKVPEQFKCTICDAVFTLKENLNKHIESYHDIKCKVCSEVFITKDILKEHLESAHGENVPLLEDNENNMGHTEAVHEESSIECACISSKKNVKNLKRRLTPQGKGVKDISSPKKARIEEKHCF